MSNIDGRRLTAEELTELRIRAVAAVQSGEAPETVVRVMGVSRSALYRWLALYREGGWENLAAHKRGGRPAKLDDSQRQWLYDSDAKPSG
jgi:transposase